MIDRDKVIKGMECCQTMLHDRGYQNSDCRICPYNLEFDGEESRINPVYCVAQLVDDALSVLKEPEPHVMTRDEIENADGYVWIDNPNYDAMSVRLIRGGKILEPYQMTKDIRNLGWDSYGKRWRCWSAQPSDEQREAAKWNG